MYEVEIIFITNWEKIQHYKNFEYEYLLQIKILRGLIYQRYIYKFSNVNSFQYIFRFLFQVKNKMFDYIKVMKERGLYTHNIIFVEDYLFMVLLEQTYISF